MTFTHKPVLLTETLAAFSYLSEKEGAIFVDGTLGLGGHSIALAKKLKTDLRIVGIDKDAEALKVTDSRMADAGLTDIFTLVHNDFHNISEILPSLGIEKVDGILLDLGVSSMQLDDKSRGFSFSEPEIELDMRMDREQTKSAYSIVNSSSQEELERILKAGEEWHFRRVANALVSARSKSPIRTVGELVEILRKTLPKKYSKTHFATDTFRALRLEINNEMEPLADTLKEMVSHLAPRGRLAVITFHSLEDRLVKNLFRKLADPCTCPPKLPHCACSLKPEVALVTRKPIIASDEEIAENPRARSAKLRIVEKV